MTNTGSKQLQVNRCSVDSITLYEITEQELELLEQGSPSSTLLNFAIFSLSIGLAFVTTLLTVEIKESRVFSVFVILAVIGMFAGLILLVVWRRMAKSTAGVVQRIKARAVVSTQSPDTQPSPTNAAVLASTPAGPAQAG